jgi:hypothetical protein
VKLAFAVLILLVFVILGLALAVDFRGVATEWAERSLVGRPFLRRPSLEAARHWTTRAMIVNRIVGAVFALGGLAILIAVIATA